MEEQMIEYIQEKWNCVIAKTSTFCLVDGILIRDNQIKGIIELKNRNHTYEQMLQFSTLLISFDKIKKGVELSEILSVPFYVVMRTSDNIYLYWEICDNGMFSIGMKLDHKETNKRTEINNDGSKAIRYNAFINISQAKSI
jgi:hypothetical protein